MKRITTALLAGATVATLAYASASALQVDSKPLQVGKASVTCDSDGVEVAWGLETDDNSVRSVTVKGIDEACWGQAKLFVDVNSDGVREGAVDITGAEHKFSFNAPYPTPREIDNVRVWIG